MKLFKYILTGLLAFGASTSLLAMPAMRGFRTVEQPDGSTIQIQVTGDEHLHFTTLPDGTLIRQDIDGYYRIAKIDADGAIVSTGLDLSEAAKGIKLTDGLIQDVQTRRLNGKSVGRRAPQTGLGLADNSYPVIGSTKGLIILVQYTDVKFRSSYDAQDYFNDMINGENFTQYGGTGSALAYFTQQSGGKFTPEFDVYGPVTLPYNQSYYGGNNRYGNDSNPHMMVIHAMDILDQDVDFSQYDTDRNGLIDNVYVIYAGQGEADYGSSNTVWPHSWDVRAGGVYKKYDGVTVGRYACSNEWDQRRPDGVGTFIHEFSHVMGLPDLYHTTRSGVEYTPGTYSVLDYGPYNNDGRTPPNYGAYEKNAMGWYEPIMLDDTLSVTLHNINSGEFGLMPTEKTTEFFLFENRQQEDWDKYIPAHGMLIWHIDYKQDVFSGNTVNNTKNHQYVDIVEANNTASYVAAPGYTFPGTRNVTSFTSETTPAMKSWSGQAIDYPITDIAENDGIITFNVAGGAVVVLDAPEPMVVDHSGEEGYFIASWDPVEGATDYLVNVYAGEGTLLPDYDNFSTQGATMCRVENLLDGVKEYYFTVSATDGKTSSVSAPVSIVLEGDSYTTLLKDINVDSENVEYFNMQGIRVMNPQQGTLLIERRGRSVRKILY